MWQMSSLSCLDGGKSSVVSPAFKSHADDFLKQKFQWKAFFSLHTLTVLLIWINSKWFTELSMEWALLCYRCSPDNHRSSLRFHTFSKVPRVQTITQCHHRIANRYVRSQFIDERILHMGSMWATDVLAFERVFFFHLQDGSGSTNTNSRSDLGNKTSWLGFGNDPGQCLLVGSHWTKKSIIQMKHLFMKLQVTRHSIWRRTEGASQRQTWISTNPELRTTYIYIRILLNIWT